MAKRKAAKRPYGSGSIYANNDGTYTVAVRLKSGEKPVRKRAASREAAEALRADLVRQRDKGIDIRHGSQPVNDFANYWFREVYLQRDLQERSNRHTLEMIERYILPAIGEQALNSVTHAQLQQLLNNLRTQRAPYRPLAPQTKHHVATVLKELFAKALIMDLIDRDPTIGLELPRIERSEKPALTSAQVRALLLIVESHPYAIVFHLMATLGLRLGEALALRRTDFNADFSEVTIAQAIDYHELTMDAPKQRSKRPLPIPPRLAKRCAAQWALVKAQAADPTPGALPPSLLCPSEAGTPIQPSNFEKVWHGYTSRRKRKKGLVETEYIGFRARAGLPDGTTLHDLRRFLATMLEDLDIGQRTIGHILGHGAKNVTERYIRRHMPTMRRALEKLEQAIWDETAAEMRA
jgi:integrase